jgi:N utilization substance protein A
MAVSANRLELLQIADAVAREKLIDREIVLDAMADAIQKAARSRYGSETDILAEINPKTGEIKLQRRLEVVDKVEDYSTQIALELARDRNPKIEIGQFVTDPLPPMDFGRIAAQSAKQVIVQKVREAERDKQYDEYKDRIGDIVNGTVKRVEYGNVIVDLGRGEGIIRRDETIPRENFRYGDRVRAYVYDVRREQRGPQIFLSRTHPQFMVKLFTMEVPEIYDGVIDHPLGRPRSGLARQDRRHPRTTRRSIRSAPASVCAAAASRPSSANCRAKRSTSFPGHRFDRPTFIVNALQPAEVAKVVLDEDAERIEVVVPDEQLSLAIGRRGQNVRLASAADRLGYRHPDRAGRGIERRQKEFNERTELFMECAQRRRDGRPGAGFRRLQPVEEVAYIDLE